MSSPPRKTSKAKSAEQRAKKAVLVAEEEVEKAVRKEAGKAERAVTRHMTPKAAQRPPGKKPEAFVTSRHGPGMISRHARGFSLGELLGAGIPPLAASRWGVMVDPRRRSIIEGNVTSLKGWHSHAPASEVKKGARVIEEKVEKVAKEAEKGVEAVEREAAKAERAVRKGAKKTEKAVRQRAQRKPRPKKKGSS